MDKLVIKQTTGSKGKPKRKAKARAVSKYEVEADSRIYTLKDMQAACREILNKKPIRCAMCSQELRLLSWNTKVDVLVCNNLFCTKYRHPISVEKAALADPATPIAAVIRGANPPENPYKGKDSRRAFGKGQQSLVDNNWMKIR